MKILQILQILLLMMLMFCYSGCATGMLFEFGRHNCSDGIYPATRMDTEFFTSDFSKRWNNGEKLDALLTSPIVLLDYPFSLTFDTLLLPYDMFELRRN